MHTTLPHPDDHASPFPPGTAAGAVVVDAAGRVVSADEGFVALVGRPVEELIGVPVIDVVHLDDRVSLRRNVRSVIDHGAGRYTTRVARPDGVVRPVVVATAVLPVLDDQEEDETDGPRTISVVWEQRRGDADIHAEVAAAGQAVLVAESLDDALAAVTSAAERALRADIAELVEVGDEPARSLAGFALAHAAPVVVSDLRTETRFDVPAPLLAAGVVSSVAVLVAAKKPLGVLSVHCTTPRHFGPEEVNALQSLANIAAGAIERARITEELEALALQDPLTGLANRTLLLGRIEQLRGRRRRRHRSDKVAVLFCDLDRFGQVNDSWGHEAGDRLLVEVSERLRAAVRDGDTVARLGGDEFAILCEDTDEAGALAVAERIAAALAEPFRIDGSETFVTASIGIALTTADTACAAKLLREADTAMYRAKRFAGVGVELFDEEMQTQAVDPVETDSALRKSVERRELVLHWQPQIPLEANAEVWAEALLRWQHPERGLLAPGAFMHVAEESGLIVPIGGWVVHAACEQLDEWERLGVATPDAVSVNISARQLADPGLVDLVREAVRDTGIDPYRLVLEVTATALLADRAEAERILGELRETGVRVAVDDVGLGDLPLSELQGLPVDALKIDRSFVSGVTADLHDRSIVGAVIDLGHAEGLTVVAEGIETLGQLAELRYLGCDVGQGYLWTQPIEGAVLPAWLEDRRLGRRIRSAA